MEITDGMLSFMGVGAGAGVGFLLGCAGSHVAANADREADVWARADGQMRCGLIGLGSGAVSGFLSVQLIPRGWLALAAAAAGAICFGAFRVMDLKARGVDHGA
jgi:hypothetical protein